MNNIKISQETKEKILSFGVEGESYDIIINRIYSLAVKEQLREFNKPIKGFISIKDALKEAERKWPKKK